MTLSESAINEILAVDTVTNEGGGTDLVRQLAQFGIQELTEAEAVRNQGNPQSMSAISEARWRVERPDPGACRGDR